MKRLNWKIILILASFSILVGGGVLLYKDKKEEEARLQAIEQEMLSREEEKELIRKEEILRLEIPPELRHEGENYSVCHEFMIQGLVTVSADCAEALDNFACTPKEQVRIAKKRNKLEQEQQEKGLLRPIYFPEIPTELQEVAQQEKCEKGTAR